MEPTEHAHAHPHVHAKDYSALYTPIAIILAGALIALGIYFGSLNGQSAQNAAMMPPSSEVDPSSLTSDGLPFIGAADAPATMYYWYDYHCPYCLAVEFGHPQIPTPPAFPEVVSNYVDTGKLKVVFKAYPFKGEGSILAEMYKFAVWETNPEKFWHWHEAVMKSQVEESFGSDAFFVALANKTGLNGNALKAKVAEKKEAYMEQINTDREEGVAMGVNGTPGFVIGTKRIDGAVPFSDFDTAIQAAL